MKKLLTLIAVIFSFSSFSQDYYGKDAEKSQPAPAKKSAPDSLSKFYLGTATGIDNYIGLLGIGAHVRLHNTFFLRAGAGIGSWGRKLTIGIKYDRKYSKCWSYGLSYSSCSGLKDFKITMETVSGGATVQKEVTLDLLRASSINLTASYNWYFRRNKLFYLEFGYAASVENEPYKVKDGSVLTPASKSALRILQPGGVILSLGFMFGL